MAEDASKGQPAGTFFGNSQAGKEKKPDTCHSVVCPFLAGARGINKTGRYKGVLGRLPAHPPRVSWPRGKAPATAYRE